MVHQAVSTYHVCGHTSVVEDEQPKQKAFWVQVKDTFANLKIVHETSDRPCNDCHKTHNLPDPQEPAVTEDTESEPESEPKPQKHAPPTKGLAETLSLAMNETSKSVKALKSVQRDSGRRSSRIKAQEVHEASEKQRAAEQEAKRKLERAHKFGEMVHKAHDPDGSSVARKCHQCAEIATSLANSKTHPQIESNMTKFDGGPFQIPPANPPVEASHLLVPIDTLVSPPPKALRKKLDGRMQRPQERREHIRKILQEGNELPPLPPQTDVELEDLEPRISPLSSEGSRMIAGIRKYFSIPNNVQDVEIPFFVPEKGFASKTIRAPRDWGLRFGGQEFLSIGLKLSPQQSAMRDVVAEFICILDWNFETNKDSSSNDWPPLPLSPLPPTDSLSDEPEPDLEFERPSTPEPFLKDNGMDDNGNSVDWVKYFGPEVPAEELDDEEFSPVEYSLDFSGSEVNPTWTGRMDQTDGVITHVVELYGSTTLPSELELELAHRPKDPSMLRQEILVSEGVEV